MEKDGATSHKNCRLIRVGHGAVLECLPSMQEPPGFNPRFWKKIKERKKTEKGKQKKKMQTSGPSGGTWQSQGRICVHYNIAAGYWAIFQHTSWFGSSPFQSLWPLKQSVGGICSSCLAASQVWQPETAGVEHPFPLASWSNNTFYWSLSQHTQRSCSVEEGCCVMLSLYGWRGCGSETWDDMVMWRVLRP